MMHASSSTQPSQAYGSVKFSTIVKATNNFHKSRKIGEGGFGDVFVGVLPNRDVVAFKRFNDKTRQGPTEFFAEVDTFSKLHHPNLVSVIGYCNVKEDVKWFPMSTPQKSVGNKKEMILMYEYMPKGTLKDLLHKLGDHLSFDERIQICVDVARGLHYLHATGTIHLDIKSSNILFAENGTAKISDFGLSVAGTSERSASTLCAFTKGSFGYMAPEMSYGMVSRKADVYSYGVVMCELLFRKLVVDTTRDDIQRNLLDWVEKFLIDGDLMDIIDSDLRDEVSSEFVKDFFKIAQRCLHKRKEERASMAEVLDSLDQLQKRFNNSLRPMEISGDSTSPSPDVKEFMYVDLKKSTRRFSENIYTDNDMKVVLGWVNQNTLAPSNHVYGIPVAVQVVTSEIPAISTEWPREVNFSGQLAHSNIIRLVGRCINGDERLLVYEHMKKSLSQFIEGDEPFSWGTRLHILKGIARAMNYLYTTKGVLCHFKSSGILLDENFNAKIGSFGWGERSTNTVGRGDRIWLNGVFGYLSADSYTSNGGRFVKNDIHCFGSVLLETITGKLLTGDDFKDRLKSLESVMQASDIKSKEKKLKKIMDPRLKNNCPIKDVIKCATFVLNCVAIEHEVRPSRDDILLFLNCLTDVNE